LRRPLKDTAFEDTPFADGLLKTSLEVTPFEDGPLLTASEGTACEDTTSLVVVSNFCMSRGQSWACVSPPRVSFADQLRAYPVVVIVIGLSRDH
jgi:hypothetical protein